MEWIETEEDPEAGVLATTRLGSLAWLMMAVIVAIVAVLLYAY